MKNIPLKIIMSKGDAIKIASEELAKVLEGINTGSAVMIKTGIFNPSFYVSIIRDEERVQEFYESLKMMDKPWLKDDEKKEEMGKDGPHLLKDMFEDIRKLAENKKMLEEM